MVAKVSDGTEGGSLFKLSGSIQVEPTSGQQCWQPFVSAQHVEGLHGDYCCDSALLHWKMGLPGVQQQGGARWGREMNEQHMSGFLAVYVFAV